MELNVELMKAEKMTLRIRNKLQGLQSISYRMKQLDDYLYKKNDIELDVEAYEVLQDSYRELMNDLKDLVKNA